MHKARLFRSLRMFVLIVLTLIIIGGGGISLWFSNHYKQIIRDRLPAFIVNSSDSVYHISFRDISINIFNHKVTLTDIKLWPDEKQVAALRQQRRKVPVTLSTVSIPLVELYGIKWSDLVSNRSFDCKNAIVHDLKWLMECTPHPEDSLFTSDKKKVPVIGRMTVSYAHFISPDITYHYKGQKENFQCIMKGGSAVLNNWVYNYDQSKDTSTFLYAQSGKVRFDDFIFSKPNGRYVVRKPDLDFESGPSSVQLKSVAIKHLVDYDPQSNNEKEVYNLDFPVIELVNFNWNKLITSGELHIPIVNANEPIINVRYIRKNASDNSVAGSYPNQLLLEVGLKTNIEELNIKNGRFQYAEVTKKGDEGVIEFTGIHGVFNNITNLPAIIARHKSCIVKLKGKYMGKSPITANFDLSLTDKKGRYKLDGTVEDLSGDAVTPQAQVFTIVKVTSFHLSHMDMHIEGDEANNKGDFTVLYEDLKISLFKFDTKKREGKKGLFAFLGSSLLLYPDNPMPGKEIRKVSTSDARDTKKGFISTVWHSMYRAAKKTAIRHFSGLY